MKKTRSKVKDETLFKKLSLRMSRSLLKAVTDFIKETDVELDENSVDVGVAISLALGYISGDYLKFCGDNLTKGPDEISGNAIILFSQICRVMGIKDFVECTKAAADRTGDGQK